MFHDKGYLGKKWQDTQFLCHPSKFKLANCPPPPPFRDKIAPKILLAKVTAVNLVITLVAKQFCLVIWQTLKQG